MRCIKQLMSEHKLLTINRSGQNSFKRYSFMNEFLGSDKDFVEWRFNKLESYDYSIPGIENSLIYIYIYIKYAMTIFYRDYL